MVSERRQELAGQLDWYWEAMLWPRLEGLTDEEYFWEPIAGSWSVRPAGIGRFSFDWQYPEPTPPPFTTLAWRMSHIGHVLSERASHHFGDRSYPDRENIEWPGTARAALAFLGRAYKEWSDGVSALDDLDLEEHKEGPPGTIDIEFPFAEVILHVNREVIHHGGEVALLRDLYRERGLSS
jgi:hypothetical protein